MSCLSKPHIHKISGFLLRSTVASRQCSKPVFLDLCASVYCGVESELSNGSTRLGIPILDRWHQFGS